MIIAHGVFVSFYAHLYNKCVFELIQRKKGKYEAALFARAATAGGQRFPIHVSSPSVFQWNSF